MKKFSFNSIIRKQLPKGVYWDPLEISASAPQHQHRHWNWHWYRHCKKFIFACRTFFKKIEWCSFLCLVMASVPVYYKYSFFYDFLFSHPKASICVLEKGYLSFRKHPFIVFWKHKCSEHFCIICIISRETSRVGIFLHTLAGLPWSFPKSSFEQLFCREAVSTCFCKKETHSTRYLRNFP